MSFISGKHMHRRAVLRGLGATVALPFLDTSAGPALEATLAASFGVSLAVQFAVFNARVARDGRPIRPARRGADARSTLAR